MACGVAAQAGAGCRAQLVRTMRIARRLAASQFEQLRRGAALPQPLQRLPQPRAEGAQPVSAC